MAKSLHIEIKYKVNADKNNFLYFRCIECMSFKTEFTYLCAKLVHRVHYLAFSFFFSEEGTIRCPLWMKQNGNFKWLIFFFISKKNHKEYNILDYCPCNARIM
jgi:hypothetical protein